MRPWGSTTVEQRFWAKVQKGDGCWLFTGATSNGYGHFWDGSRVVLAHRYAYELRHGPIPPRLTLDHLCRTTLCVNPTHVEPVEHRVNVGRGTKAQQTHCIHGHEFDEGNTYRRSNGTRQCRACRRERMRMRTIARGLSHT